VLVESRRSLAKVGGLLFIAWKRLRIIINKVVLVHTDDCESLDVSRSAARHFESLRLPFSLALAPPAPRRAAPHRLGRQTTNPAPPATISPTSRALQFLPRDALFFKVLIARLEWIDINNNHFSSALNENFDCGNFLNGH